MPFLVSEMFNCKYEAQLVALKELYVARDVDSCSLDAPLSHRTLPTNS